MYFSFYMHLPDGPWKHPPPRKPLSGAPEAVLCLAAPLPVGAGSFSSTARPCLPGCAMQPRTAAAPQVPVFLPGVTRGAPSARHPTKGCVLPGFPPSARPGAMRAAPGGGIGATFPPTERTWFCGRRRSPACSRHRPAPPSPLFRANSSPPGPTIPEDWPTVKGRFLPRAAPPAGGCPPFPACARPPPPTHHTLPTPPWPHPPAISLRYPLPTGYLVPWCGRTLGWRWAPLSMRRPCTSRTLLNVRACMGALRVPR